MEGVPGRVSLESGRRWGTALEVSAGVWSVEEWVWFDIGL